MLRFALKNMWIKKGKLILVTLSIVLSAGVALLAYNVSMQVREGIVNTAAYYDIIIGPSGSATQLAMNTMFFTDSPLGTIPYSYVTELEKNPEVNQVVPFSMGDSYNAARVIGTSPAFLEGKALAKGEMFDDVYEVVVGAHVAKQYGLKIGDTIVTSHGLSAHGSEHEATPLTVVWSRAPPSSSASTAWPVAPLTRFGPPKPIKLVPSTITMKSLSAGR